MFYFSRWIEAQKEAQRMRSLENVALWRWALTLQAKAWRSWMAYIVLMRNAHIRQQNAYQRFSERLAKRAIASWLTAALKIKEIAVISSQSSVSNFSTYKLFLDLDY